MTYNTETLYKIYDVLVQHCGARNDNYDRNAFVDTAERHGEKMLEYRFIGSLGFGGKVWLNNRTEPYVTCYREDETSDRRKAIDAANEHLKLI